MAQPLSSQQNSDQSANASSNSNQYIYSFSDASTSIQSPSLYVHAVTSAYKVTPSSSRQQIEKTDHLLKEQLHNFRQESSQQTQKYERAIRRALLENENVRKINVKLIAQLQDLEEEEGNVKSSLEMLDAMVHQSKQHLRENEISKQNVVLRCEDLERRNTQLFAELNITSDEMQMQKVQMETMKSTSAERWAKMQQMTVGCQKQDELVTSLCDSLETSSHSYNKLRINFNTVLAEQENARLEMERLQIEKDEDLLRRINVEAHMAKSKRQLAELRTRLHKYEETKHDAALDDEEGYLCDVSVNKIKEKWSEKLGMVKAAMQQATSDHAEVAELKSVEVECLSRDSGSQEDTEQATMLQHFATCTDKTTSECTQHDNDSIPAASRAAELLTENIDLRKHVALLKEGLRDFGKIRDAMADITAERDMLLLELESTNGARLAKQNMEEKQDDLVASYEEVNDLRRALAVTTEKLQKAERTESSLRTRLLSVSSERDELDGYLKDLNKIILEPQTCKGINHGDESKPCQSMSSEKVYVNIKSEFRSMLSSIEDLQDALNGQKLRVEELIAQQSRLELSTREKYIELSGLLDENKRQITSLESENKTLASELEERSAKHDHVQLQLDQASEFLEELRMQLSLKASTLDDELARQRKERKEFDAIVTDKNSALALVSKLQEQVRESNKSNLQLQEQVDLLQVDRALLLEKKSELMKELHNASEQTHSMRQSLKKAKDCNESIREQMSMSRRKLDEHIALVSKRAEEENFLQQRNAELVEALQSNNNMLIESRKTNERLQKELSDYKIGLTAVYEKVKAQNEETELLRKQVSVQNEDIKSLRLQQNEKNSLLLVFEQQLKSIYFNLISGDHSDGNFTFDELLVLMESETSKQQVKLKEVTEENAILEQQVYILSKQVSECRRENKEFLQGTVA